MEGALARLNADPRVGLAERALREGDARTIGEQIELSEIAAPPFEETARAHRMAELMGESGLIDVRVDDEGNVLAATPPADDASDGLPRAGPLVVSAHLDTVFPGGTDVRVSRRDGLLCGPGISDDARGLATLLALARALDAGGCRTETPLLIVATVGEEGVGDLRGVKHLFGPHGAARDASAFVSLDGAGLDRIVARGLGSRRYRVTVRGPGGHSWVDWGAPNPIHLLGEVAARLPALPPPGEPLTTLTIARWGGGTSINAIPQEAWLEIDTRSEDEGRLTALESRLRATVEDVVEGAPESVGAVVETIGDRPGGATDAEAALVRAAAAATREVGGEPELVTSSTDANIPMSRGIPAITLGCGGEAGKAHTTGEWYRNTRGVEGILRALYTVLLVAGLRE